MRIALLFCLLMVSGLKAQILFQNPSFEGTPATHTVPAPWITCFDGGSPDTQPGMFDLNMQASNGNTYISFLAWGEDNSYQEGISQQLVNPLDILQQYSFFMDIAHSYNYGTAEPGNCYGSVGVWGGFDSCGRNELLWESGPIFNADWETVNVQFTPSQNYTYLSFGPVHYYNCNGYINGLVDNISMEGSVEIDTFPSVEIVAPYLNQNIFCNVDVICYTDTIAQAVSIAGNFDGSFVSATQISSNVWKANVSFPPNNQTDVQLVAVAYFGNNVFDTDTQYVTIQEPVLTFYSNIFCANTPSRFSNTTNFNSSADIFSIWSFEDGSSTIGNTVYHPLPDTGFHLVTLTTGVANSSCIASVTDSVYVENLSPEKPELTIINNTISISNYNSNLSYKWYYSNNLSGPLLSYNSNNSSIPALNNSRYLVLVSEPPFNNYCTNLSDTILFAVTSLTEDAYNKDLLIYPNPSAGNSLDISFPENSIPLKIRIVNAIGQVLYQDDINNKITQLTISNIDLAAGLYYVIINDASRTYTKPITVVDN